MSTVNVYWNTYANKYRNIQNTKIYSFQNTYTNAEKLLAAAEELAQTGECNADDIYRWQSFVISYLQSNREFPLQKGEYFLKTREMNSYILQISNPLKSFLPALLEN